jgi:excisionase family DNA binding protein
MASKGLIAPILLVSCIPMWERTVQADHRQTNANTVAQAATELGISEGTVRSRIQHGTLPAAKDAGTAVRQSCRSGIAREIRQAVGGVLVFSTFVVYNSNTIYKMLGTEI